MKDILRSSIQSSISVKQHMLESEAFLDALSKAVDLTIEAFRSGQKALFCGNGGSAADAQHMAAELSGRFYLDRPPLFAEALHVNTSYLTAAANDYGYDAVYGRLVKAMGSEKDLLVALSTSGNSPNVLGAIAAAREEGMYVIGMTGESGGKMADRCDVLLNVPSTDTPRIQEAHILIGHILCEQVEAALFGAAEEPPVLQQEEIKEAALKAEDDYLDWL